MNAVYTSLFHISLLAPPLFLAGVLRADKKINPLRPAALFTVLLLFFDLVYLLPRVFPFLRVIDGKWNWEAKTLALVAGIAFVLVYKGLSRKDYGLTLKQEIAPQKDLYLWIAVLCMTAGGIVFASFNPAQPFSWESVAFELTLPGIEEELIYRGIFLALLNQAFGKNFSFLGARYGWGLLITALAFGLAHGVEVGPGWQFTFQPLSILITGFMGFWFGWIREKTGSLLLPVCVHNLTNTINTLIVMLK